LIVYAAVVTVLIYTLVRRWSTLRLGMMIIASANVIVMFVCIGIVSEEVTLSTGRSYDVSAKEQFDDVIIALTLGRGTVLYDRKAKHIIVIRETDITKIVPHNEVGSGRGS
jgi:hypothetical protein